jgi:hypothetical protein
VALHEIDSADIFTGPTYRAKAGPTNTGEWQTKMGNWHRNLFAGLDHTPDVPMDARLVVVEADASSPLPERLSVDWMKAIGLDRSVERRGLAVVPPAVAQRLVGVRGVRVLKPIGPRLRSSPEAT